MKEDDGQLELPKVLLCGTFVAYNLAIFDDICGNSRHRAHNRRSNSQIQFLSDVVVHALQLGVCLLQFEVLDFQRPIKIEYGA